MKNKTKLIFWAIIILLTVLYWLGVAFIKGLVDVNAMPIETPVDVFTPKEVTRQEVLDFLLIDKTNEHKRIEGVYVCEQFALALQMAGRAHSMEIYRVRVNFNGGNAHMFNAVNTIDAGTIYIDPQSDLPYAKPMIGEHICFPENMWEGGEIRCAEYEGFVIEEIIEYHDIP